MLLRLPEEHLRDLRNSGKWLMGRRFRAGTAGDPRFHAQPSAAQFGDRRFRRLPKKFVIGRLSA